MPGNVRSGKETWLVLVLSGPADFLPFKFCCSVYTLCLFGMNVGFQTCLGVEWKISTTPKEQHQKKQHLSPKEEGRQQHHSKGEEKQHHPQKGGEASTTQRRLRRLTLFSLPTLPPCGRCCFPDSFGVMLLSLYSLSGGGVSLLLLFGVLLPSSSF